MPAELMGPYTKISSEFGAPVRMRDGVTLYADVYRPDGDEAFPVLLQRTPYDKFQGVGGGLDVLRAVSHGYAVVVQDTRGRYASEGEFYPFLDEPNDGYDTVAWCAEQPWSTGKVGMFGRSYVGATQWLCAITNPPALTCIAPGITASDYYEGWTYQGGALAWGFALSWTMRQLTMANLGAISSRHDVPDGTREGLLAAFNELDCTFKHQPIVDLPHLKEPLAGYFYDWIKHSSSDEYWKRWRIEDHYPHITTPALHIGGWHDIFLLGTLRNFVGMRKQAEDATARNGQRLIVGPWHHGPFGETSGDFFFGLGAAGPAIDTDGIHLQWFDHWLKGEENGANDGAPVRIFVMGDNQWRNEQEWPLARTQYTDYYLHSGGRANTSSGDGGLSVDAPGDEAADVFLYDPRDPVPTRGGPLCCGPSFVPGGSYDQQFIENRSDVLCYTTPPLTEDLEVTGPLTVTLFAATTGADTDFTAKLVDVEPCGAARALVDGIMRGRYRKGTDTAVPITPGAVEEYTIDLVATSNVFKAGHRVRLEISSSNFPRFDRNFNTAGDPWAATECVPAVQTIMHNEQYPSRLRLPVIPAS